MKGDAQQTALAAAPDPIAKVQKRSRQHAIPVENHHLPGLQGDEQSAGAVAGMSDRHRLIQTARHFPQSHRRPRARQPTPQCENDTQQPDPRPAQTVPVAHDGISQMTITFTVDHFLPRLIGGKSKRHGRIAIEENRSVYCNKNYS